MTRRHRYSGRTKTDRRNGALPLLVATLLASAASVQAAAEPPAPAAQGQPVQVADASASAAVQDSGATDSVEEITVVGRHRAENKQDVPIPIAALSGLRSSTAASMTPRD